MTTANGLISLQLELSSLLARLPEEECQLIRDWADRHAEFAPEAFHWVFCESSSYVDTRAWAGSQLWDGDPLLAQSCASSLLGSADPDDRDTGITFLLTLRDTSFEDAALPLLSDKYPYLRILAAEYALLHGKADEAKAVIDELSASPITEISESAKSLQARY